MQNLNMLNGLYVRIDWLEFTITQDNELGLKVPQGLNARGEVDYWLNWLGIPSELFNDLGKGGYGYKSSCRHITDSIQVYYNGNEDMGIHVRVSGSAIFNLLNTIMNSKYKVDTPFDTFAYEFENDNLPDMMNEFIRSVLRIGRFTRIDIAIDDIGANYFSVSKLSRLLDNGNVVCKFKKWQNIKGSSFVGDMYGHTVYLGSRESDVFLRVYEKGLEQNIDVSWVRWELEIKHDKADIVARQLLDYDNVGSIAIGILKSYVRIVNLDNVRKTRCTTDNVWLAFTRNVESLRLTLPTRESSIDKKREWIERQCMPTLAGLIVSSGGDISFIRDDIDKHFDRLNFKDKKMFLDALKE